MVPVAGSSEHAYAHLGFITGGEFVDNLIDEWLLTNLAMYDLPSV